MTDNYLLGIDIGTYESKGVLTTLTGETIAVEVHPHGLNIPKPGWAEHDAERDWWGDFCSIARSLLTKSGIAASKIAAVGCSAIGPCMLPVDEDGNPLRPAILYGIDTRATSEIAYLNGVLGEGRIYEACGSTLSAQSVGPKILWERNNEPEIYRKAFKFVTSTTYLVFKLTGRFVVDHYTASSFHPLYDLKKGTWNEEFCMPIVEPHRLPQLAWSTDAAGYVTREASEQTGLLQGTPVIVGTVDAAAEAVSVGVVSPGQMMIMYGSTVFIIQVLDKPKSDPRLWSATYLFPDTHCILAGMSTAGALTRWMRDNFARDLLADEAAGGINAYAALAREAEQVPPGSEGIIVLPYFSGERTPVNDPRAKGVIMGLTLAHKRSHVYRAVLEGIGHGIEHHFEALREINAIPHTVVAVGGGTKNPLWMQIVSDITGKEQLIPRITIGASYGDAFLAGVGICLFSSHQCISQWIRDIRQIKPNPENATKYRKQHRLYRQLYQQTMDLMHEL